MIEMNTTLKHLSIDVINTFNSHDYRIASIKAKELLNYCTDIERRYHISADIAHLLCLSGDYKNARPLLKSLIDESENSTYVDGYVTEKLYLAYACCLYNENDYIRFFYFINKYLELAKESHPEAYATIKRLLE